MGEYFKQAELINIRQLCLKSIIAKCEKELDDLEKKLEENERQENERQEKECQETERQMDLFNDVQEKERRETELREKESREIKQQEEKERERIPKCLTRFFQSADITQIVSFNCKPGCSLTSKKEEKDKKILLTFDKAHDFYAILKFVEIWINDGVHLCLYPDDSKKLKRSLMGNLMVLSRRLTDRPDGKLFPCLTDLIMYDKFKSFEIFPFEPNVGLGYIIKETNVNLYMKMCEELCDEEARLMMKKKDVKVLATIDNFFDQYKILITKPPFFSNSLMGILIRRSGEDLEASVCSFSPQYYDTTEYSKSSEHSVTIDPFRVLKNNTISHSTSIERSSLAMSSSRYDGFLLVSSVTELLTFL